MWKVINKFSENNNFLKRIILAEYEKRYYGKNSPINFYTIYKIQISFYYNFYITVSKSFTFEIKFSFNNKYNVIILDQIIKWKNKIIFKISFLIRFYIPINHLSK